MLSENAEHEKPRTMVKQAAQTMVPANISFELLSSEVYLEEYLLICCIFWCNYFWRISCLTDQCF